METRVCKTCEISKPMTEFYASNIHSHECKICYKQRSMRNLRKRKYNVSSDEYKAMLEEQNRRCAICDVHQDACTKGFAVDHDHTSHTIRQLLCHHCNVAIGLLKDSPIIVQKALRYLMIHK